MPTAQVVNVTITAQTVTLTGSGDFIEVHCLNDGTTISFRSASEGDAVSEANDHTVMAAVAGATVNHPRPSDGRLSIIGDTAAKVQLRLISSK